MIAKVENIINVLFHLQVDRNEKEAGDIERLLECLENIKQFSPKKWDDSKVVETVKSFLFLMANAEDEVIFECASTTLYCFIFHSKYFNKKEKKELGHRFLQESARELREGFRPATIH